MPLVSGVIFLELFHMYQETETKGMSCQNCKMFAGDMAGCSAPLCLSCQSNVITSEGKGRLQTQTEEFLGLELQATTSSPLENSLPAELVGVGHWATRRKGLQAGLGTSPQHRVQINRDYRDTRRVSPRHHRFLPQKTQKQAVSSWHRSHLSE